MNVSPLLTRRIRLCILPMTSPPTELAGVPLPGRSLWVS